MQELGTDHCQSAPASSKFYVSIKKRGSDSCIIQINFERDRILDPPIRIVAYSRGVPYL